jgi:hypothetical protein
MAPLALPRKEPDKLRKLLDAAWGGYMMRRHYWREKGGRSTSTRYSARGPTEATPGTWSWLKEWTGYVVTVLPYVSSAVVLIPNLQISTKFAVLAVFGALVLLVRVLHEKAGVEITGGPQKAKRPGDGT